MRKSILGLSAVVFTMLATPAFAQEEGASEPIKITGTVGLVSDYRFRGFTQNSEDVAVQGGITVTHESGFYVGTWASSISFAGNTEVDIFGGYSTEVTPGITVDAGLLYYYYPQHGGSGADLFEPYINVSGTVGPVALKVGANYAWDQSALGDESALYIHAEPTIAIPNTPLAVVGHVGWAKSDSFLGGLDGDVLDYSIGATATYKALTFGVSYVNTDAPKFGGYKEGVGADGAVIFSIGAAF